MIEIRCTKSVGNKKQCRKICARIVPGAIVPTVEAAAENGWIQAEPRPDEYEPDGTIVVGCHKHGAFLTLPQRVSELRAMLEQTPHP